MLRCQFKKHKQHTTETKKTKNKIKKKQKKTSLVAKDVAKLVDLARERSGV